METLLLFGVAVFILLIVWEHRPCECDPPHFIANDGRCSLCRRWHP